MLKTNKWVILVITDQGKTRIRRERRRGGGRGSMAGEMQQNALVFFRDLASIQLFLLANYLSKNYYPKKSSLESTDLPDK